MFPTHSSLKKPSSYKTFFSAAQTTALPMPQPALSGIGTALTSPFKEQNWSNNHNKSLTL